MENATRGLRYPVKRSARCDKRVVWGRIGNRCPRERSETFADRTALERPRAAARARSEQRTERPTRAIEQAILEAHGLPLEQRASRTLVARWHAATVALLRHLEAKVAEMLDLVDVSTLAGMFVTASAATAA